MTSPDRPRGCFITIEGPDGSGKTLQAKRLAEALSGRGHDVLLTREPGGTRLGDQLYDLLMGQGGELIDPVADALLFNAARAQHVATIIRPALAAGRVVISARYADSTMAYQGYGLGVDLATLRRIIQIATGGLVPDRTILLDLPVEAGLKRKTPDTITRFESAYDVPYHLRVRTGFLEMAAAEPGRWVVVDGDRDPDAVFADVQSAALEVLGMGEQEADDAHRSEPPATAARMHR